jgi:hypothetical protein
MKVEEIFESLYAQSSHLSDSLKKIEEDITEYPAFPIPYLLRLNCINESDSKNAEALSSAGLHISNPLILQSFLIQMKAGHQSNEKESKSILSISVEETTNSGTASAAQDELLFEPLYMTDYFASQGIKLSEDQLQKDQLGKQLKSFTEWLKTMKKTPGHKPTDLQSPLDPKVEKLAEKSNEETEVITESMADIYLEQGKKDKAIQVYEKLSLQFPAKSVYFARKIESLK